MSFTAAHDKISRTAPQKRLITARTFTSIAVQIGVIAAFQAMIYIFTINQDWFCSVTGMVIILDFKIPYFKTKIKWTHFDT